MLALAAPLRLQQLKIGLLRRRCSKLSKTQPDTSEKPRETKPKCPPDHPLKVSTGQLPAAPTGAPTTSSGGDGSAIPPTEQKFSRPKRLERPGAVRMGFIPEEWFQFFYKRTGVTGPYMFGIGLITYLVSKEIYVLDHDYYNGLSMAILATYTVKMVGPKVSAYADKEIDKWEKELNETRTGEIQKLLDAIEAEKKEQWRAEGALMLMDEKKKNIERQLEAAYREAALDTFNLAIERLDYQVECRHVERRVNHKHMVNWVAKGMISSLAPGQKKAILDKAIADFTAMAVRYN